MEEDAPAQGGKLAARPSKETTVMFHVSEGDGGLPEQQNASPGLKEVGIWSLTLHGDGRDAVGQHVKAEEVFNFVTDYARRKLWDTTSHMLVPNQKPFDFKPEQRVYTFTSVNEHFTFVRPDYIHVSFMRPAQVYVFLLSMTKVPQWLRNDFEPARTPGMAITWQLAFHGKVLAILSQKMETIKSSRLKCWVRKEHCVPGVQYTFGGTEGNNPLEDYTYMLAWRPLDEGEEVNTGGKSVVTNLVREEDMEDELKQLHNMVQAVDGDDYGLLVSSCETYNRIVTTAAKRAALAQGLPADFDVRRPPKRPSFLTSGGRPLTTVAAMSNAQPRLLLYLISQGAEIDGIGFKYLLANSKQLPSGGYCSVTHLVLSYLAHQRNPISCALVFAQVLEDSATSNSAKAKEWRELSSKLRALATDLVGHLDKLDLAEEEDEEGEAGAGAGGGSGSGGKKGSKGSKGPALPSDPNAPTMPAAISDVVAPRGVACSINDASPLMVAYDTNDLEFMSAPVVQGYLQQRWLGPDYILLALQEKGSTFHYQDHHLLLHVLEGSGFVGSLGKPVMKLVSYLLHALVFASRAFYDSPRGRWIMKMMLEAFFLYIFHSIQLMTDEAAFVWQHVVLLLYVGGMLVDEVLEGAHQYHGRIAMYFQSGFNIVEAICWLLLVASIGLKIAMWTVPDGQDNPLYPHLATAKHFLYNTASIFVWSRLLQYIIPLYDGMGSQLMVISQMIREVLKFAVPGIILMTGVCFTLYSMFRFRGIDKFDSFPMVMLMLFRTFLGETMFEIMEEESTTEYNLYGNIIILLYALTATVVLANLLIALISYHFQPEKTESQSKFQMAEILAHYEYMVEHHLVGAPFSVPQLLVANLLPSGARQKGSSSKMAETFALSPMDGIVVSGENTENKFLPTGSNEIPYLLFLLTLYPTMLGLAWALYFGMAPYAILYFTFIGYKKWTGQSSDKNSGSLAGGSGSAKVAPKPSAGRTPNGNDDGAAGADEPQGPGSGTGTDMLELSGGHGGGGGPSLPYGFEEWDTSQRMASLARLALRTTVYLATRPLWFLAGCLGYLVLLGGLLVLIWLGVYTWVGKLIFHSYWVVRGWLQGWFGATNIVLAKKDGPTAASTLDTTNTARTLERAQDRTWVRVQQAHLKNGGQVITREELLSSFKEAGFKGSDRRLALAGAIAQSDAGALLRRRKSMNGKALAAVAADLAAAAAAGGSLGVPDPEHVVSGPVMPLREGKVKHGLAGEERKRSEANLEHSHGEEEDDEDGEGTSSSDSSSDDGRGHGGGRGGEEKRFGDGSARATAKQQLAQQLGAAGGGGMHAHAAARQAGASAYGALADPGVWDPKVLRRAVRKVARGLEAELKQTVAGLKQGLQEAAHAAAGAGAGASTLSLPPPPPLPPAGPPASLSIGRRPSNGSGSGSLVQRRESGGLGPM